MWIERHLLAAGNDGEISVIDQSRIDNWYDPLVIIGDPGMGKTTLMRHMCERQYMTYIHAAELVRADDPESLLPDVGHVLVDGLDEIASPGRAGATDAVMRKLREAGNPPFILSCRAAEWREAADRARIEDDGISEVVTLYLAPMGGDGARAFLENEFPGLEVHAFLEKLESPALRNASGNPLSMRLLGEIAQAGGELPENRTEIFARACRAMLGRDGREQVVRLVRRDEDELLLASGAICVTLLVCDLLGVHEGARPETPAGFLNASDIDGLPLAGAAADALRTRLFRADGEGRFSYLHRVVAEYLGAAWLTRCVDEGLAADGILALLSSGGVPGSSPVPGCSPVPTALRGLHAWIARLSPALSGRVFAADPYAVLRDGETERLETDQARALLAALKVRSGEDPGFHAENRGVHQALGLIRPELRNDIAEIVSAPGTHSQISAFLIEAMGVTDLTADDGRTFEGILFDRGRDYRERLMAFWSLSVAGILTDDETVVLRLLDIEDADSARLACEILASSDFAFAAARKSGKATRAELKLVGEGDTGSEKAAESAGREPFAALDTARLAALLDFISRGAPSAIAEAEAYERVALTNLARDLAARVLKTDPGIAPQRVWEWICWADGTEGADSRERLAAVFRSDRTLRATVVQDVLMTPHQGGIWMTCRELEKTGLGLDPVKDDLDGLMEALRVRSENGSIDPETWREVLEFARSHRWNAAPGCARAAAEADNEREPPAGSDESSGRASAEPNAGDEGGGAGTGGAQWAGDRHHRTTLSEQADMIAAGDFRALALPAAVYLGRFEDLDEGESAPLYVSRDASLAPTERLREFLGEELSERVLDGFVAVLGRDDLPRASAIAQIHIAGGEYEAEAPLICGIDVALRRGVPLGTVERTTLEAACMAWRRARASARGGQIDIGPALEAAAFRGIEDVERHFRASIEPQLACNREFVDDLDRLEAEYGFASHGLAGRLSLEWLRSYPDLNGHAQTELMTCALECAPRDAVRELIVDCRERVHPDERAKLVWLSVAFVLDPNGSRQALLEAAESSSDFIGFVREQIGSMFRFAETPLNSLLLVVEVFGGEWPRMVERPGSGRAGRGWNDPRDASAFIERTILAIANRPEPEASEALVAVIANHAPSYADTARQALAFQCRARREFEYRTPTVDGFRALATNTPDGTG